jgi:pimeloyl-ACP methyl ester carboxylesterase
MKRIVAVFIAVLLLIGILIVNAADKSIVKIPDPQEYQITLTDGLILHTWMYPSIGTKPAPLMLLLPMMAHTHTSYEPFIDALYQRAHSDSTYRVPAIMSFDLRGHGLSTDAGKKKYSYDSMTKAEFTMIPVDIEQALAFILADSTHKLNGKDITVIGASIGANSAIMTTRLTAGITKVVMLSPGENYRDLAPGESVKQFEGPILVFAGAEDTYSAESSRKLAEFNPTHSRLMVFEGPDHGTDIINNSDKAMQSLVDWLSE